MIKIFIKEKNKKIESVLITGHAGFANKGKDIVCSATSSIVITTINAALKIDDGCLDWVQTDELLVKVNKHDDVTEALVTNMVELLENLSNQYGDYIEINKEESSI